MISSDVDLSLSSKALIKRASVLILFAFLFAIRIPFFLTNHVQEDAYISWRCAQNLAHSGVIGFNPNERVSASTSHLYVLFTAGIIRLVGDAFVPVILSLNTAMLVAAVMLIAFRLSADRKQAMWVAAAGGLMPAALLASYGGMETSLLLLLLALALRGGTTEEPRWRATAAAAMFLLPWTRPDAIAFGGLLLAYFAWDRRRFPYLALTALFGGMASLLVFNRFYFGAALPQTVIAKSLAYHPLHSAVDILHRATGIFLGVYGYPGLLSPNPSRYCQFLSPPISIAAIFILAIYIYRLGASRRGKTLAWLVSATMIIPAFYAVGGIIFPWYFWPSSVLGFIAIFAALTEWTFARSARTRSLAATALCVAMLLLAAAQWCLSLNWGTQEYLYRASIGRNLATLAKPTDRLFLEPAGYIPFFSKCYTFDQVGLVSPLVTDYRKRFGNERWCYEFIRAERPEFIVQRRPFFTNSVFDVDGRLTSEQRPWFDANYDRIAQYDYDPASYHSSSLATRICRFGSAIGYDVYRIRGSSRLASPNFRPAPQ